MMISMHRFNSLLSYHPFTINNFASGSLSWKGRPFGLLEDETLHSLMPFQLTYVFLLRVQQYSQKMKIEHKKDWCCCYQSELKQEELQESVARNNRSKNNHSQQEILLEKVRQPYFSPPKQIFSFRELRWKSLSPQKQIPIHKHQSVVRSPSTLLTISKSLPKQSIPQIKSQQNQRMTLSPEPQRRVMATSPLKEVRNPTVRFYFIESSHTPVEMPKSEKAKLGLSNPQQGKMLGKRVKTVEEQTEYSSKHSQIYFKNGSEQMQTPCFSFKNSFTAPQKHVFFKEDNESEKCPSLLKFPSCKEVSAHEEIDNSLTNQLFQNARTLQTIVTSTEVKSRQPSLGFNFLKSREISKVTPKNSGDTAGFPSIDSIEHKSELESIYQTPNSRVDIEPQEQRFNSRKGIQNRPFSPETQSNMFYSEQTFKKKFKSPKISVLNIPERDNSEEDELRDKIDHNYLKSQHCSMNSPFLSINQSLKMVNDERSAVVTDPSPQHSRQVSCDLPFFRDTLQQLKRTNTIESLNSSTSEHSFLDMKFTQKNRFRRGVSKLV